MTLRLQLKMEACFYLPLLLTLNSTCVEVRMESLTDVQLLRLRRCEQDILQL